MITESEYSLNPSPVVYLYQIDFSTSKIGTTDILYWSPFRNGTSDIVYDGKTYSYMGIDFAGLTMESGGKLPSPSMTIMATKGNILAQRMLSLDIRGTRITRIKTYANYLDGAGQADPAANRKTTFYINSLSSRVGTTYKLVLSTNYGLEGINNKANRVLNSFSCINKYRTWDAATNKFVYTPVKDGGCPWGNPDEQANYSEVPNWGTVYFDGGDQSVAEPSKDRCALGAASCVKRFCQTNPLQGIPWLADPKGQTKDTGACK